MTPAAIHSEGRQSTFYKNKSINTEQSFHLFFSPFLCVLVVVVVVVADVLLALNENRVEKLIKLKVMAATLLVN